MTVKQKYNIGDSVWIYGVRRGNTKPTKGKIIKSLDLSECGYNDVTHYVIEIPTEIEPLLEIRTWHAVPDHTIFHTRPSGLADRRKYPRQFQDLMME